MSNLRAICRPHAVFASMACCYRSMGRALSVDRHNCSLGRPPPPPPPRCSTVWFDRLGEQRHYESRVRQNRQRRMVSTKASNWTQSKSPYETLGKLSFIQISSNCVEKMKFLCVCVCVFLIMYLMIDLPYMENFALQNWREMQMKSRLR